MAPAIDFIDLCSDSDPDSKAIPTSALHAQSRGSLTATSRAILADKDTGRTTAATVKTEPTELAPLFRRYVKSNKPVTLASVQLDTTTKPKKIKKPARSAPATNKNEHVCTPRTDAASLIDKLNNAQRRAVTSASNTVAILAGPGSGKTHTLTSRVAWLIDMMGYAPSNVIVATFTVKAAREMKERIGKVLGDGREKKIVLGTFHSVSLRYLSAYGTRIGLEKGFTIVDDGDSRSILKRIIKRLNSEVDPGMVRGWISKKKAKGCLGLSEKEQEKEMQRRGRPHGGVGNENKDYLQRMETIYDEYQKHLASLNLLDYDDLLVKCTELLRAHPQCVSNVQAVLIDEYQDTNGIQFELMKLFAQARNRITVVGDPDQSIYGWRSAEITNLSRFLCDYPDTVEIALEENYRSSRCILDTSLQVIKQDNERYDKSLLSYHKKGTLPVLRRLYSATHEARWIVQEIRRATLMSGGMMDHGDVAILVRSAFLSRPIEQALAKAAIPYRMVGGHKFFERAEIKILVDYLRVINQPNNNESVSRIINVPKRGFGAVALQGFLEESETSGMSLWTLLTKRCKGQMTTKTLMTSPTEKKTTSFINLIEALRKRLWDVADREDEKVEELDDSHHAESEDGDCDEDDSGTRRQPNKHDSGLENQTSSKIRVDPAKPYNLVELIVGLIEQLDYKTYIREKYGGDEEARWANVEEFMTLATEFMNNAKQLMAEDELPEVDNIEQAKDTSVLSKFIANITLSADADKNDEEKKKPMVTISTIHAAKGLEWPIVFIPAAYDGSLPHSRSDDFNEERRLLYVAMTRAKCLLNVSYSLYASHNSNEGKSQSEQALSPFLEPVADAWFAEQGPSFDRELLQEVGDILGRPVPPDSEIYKTPLPYEVPMEDDLLPLDPRTASDDGDEDNGYGYSGRRRGAQQQAQQKQTSARRQAYDTANYNLGAVGGGGGGGGGTWQRGYSTTMERGSSEFTMGSSAAYTGFVTAAQHRVNHSEDAHEVAGPEAAGDKKRQRVAGKGADRKAMLAGQQTIMQSFVRSNSTSTAPGATDDAEIEIVSCRSAPRPEPASMAIPRQGGAFQRAPGMFSANQQRGEERPAALPGIPVELKSRSVGGVRGNMMSVAGRQPGGKSSGTRGTRDSAGSSARATRHYSHFSSPPPESEMAQLAEKPSKPVALPQPQQPLRQDHNPFAYNRPRPYKAPKAPQPVGFGKENRQQGTGKAVDVVMGSTVCDEIVRPVPASRPAATFHSTTFTQALATNGSHGGIRSLRNSKRPAASMTGGSVERVDKLRMPFKPPSIKRP